MYGGYGLYIHFTMTVSLQEVVILPPPGLFLGGSHQTFGLFRACSLACSPSVFGLYCLLVCVYTWYYRPVDCVLVTVVHLYVSLNITVMVHGMSFLCRHSSCVWVRTVSYRIVCGRGRMAPRSARRTAAGGMLYVVNTTLFR